MVDLVIIIMKICILSVDVILSVFNEEPLYYMVFFIL